MECLDVQCRVTPSSLLTGPTLNFELGTEVQKGNFSATQPALNSSSCSKKQLVVLLLSHGWDGHIHVHCRVTPTSFLPGATCTCGFRETVLSVLSKELTSKVETESLMF